MATIIRWFMLQKKKVKTKLALYSLIEQFIESDQLKDVWEQFQTELAKQIAAQLDKGK